MYEEYYDVLSQLDIDEDQDSIIPEPTETKDRDVWIEQMLVETVADVW